MLTGILADAVEMLRRAQQRQGLSDTELARRTRNKHGRPYNVRTIERLFSGETLDLRTIEAVAAALRVDLDVASIVEVKVLSRLRQGTHQDKPNRTILHNVAPGAVFGWEEAARRLRLHRNTLLRYRRAAGVDRKMVAWWEDDEALEKWFRAIARKVAEATVLEQEADTG